MALTISSFAGILKDKPDSKSEQNFSTSKVFYYISESTSEGQFRNITNWTEGNSSGHTCGLGDNKPCQITANDINDLASKLSGRSNAQVLLITDTNRE